MPRRSPSTDDLERVTRDSDRGSAPLEFIGVGVILLVPLVYLVLALGAIQQQTLGVEAAARHAARAISLAPDAATASARAEAVLSAMVREYGMDGEAVAVEVSCLPKGPECPAAGATVQVRVRTQVPLPLVPGLFGLDRLASIPIEAEGVQKMSRLWSEG